MSVFLSQSIGASTDGGKAMASEAVSQDRKDRRARLSCLGALAIAALIGWMQVDSSRNEAARQSQDALDRANAVQAVRGELPPLAEAINEQHSVPVLSFNSISAEHVGQSMYSADITFMVSDRWSDLGDSAKREIAAAAGEGAARLVEEHGLDKWTGYPNVTLIDASRETVAWHEIRHSQPTTRINR